MLWRWMDVGVMVTTVSLIAMNVMVMNVNVNAS